MSSVTYSNSSLVEYTKISPNKNTTRVHNTYNPTGKITKITIHHMAGNLSIESCGSVFASSSRQASSNYGIGTDGRIGMYVEEKHRSWCSSSPANDYNAITIEVANSATGGDWPVSDKALASLIKLCVDICERNGISKLTYDGTANGSLTRHNMFAATTCPGNYLQGKFDYIAEQVNAALGGNSSSSSSSGSSTSSGSSSSSGSGTSTADSFMVKVTHACLNIRKGAGTSYDIVGQITDKGTYTIVETNSAGTWGKLKSGEGWICITADYVTKVSSTSSSSSGSSASSSSLKAGDKVTLSSTALYASAAASSKSATKSGTYYIYDATVTNNRIRITNSAGNVGKTPAGTYVTGWVNVSDIGGSTSASSGYPKTMTVSTNSSNLNIRKTASSSGTILGSIPKGTKISVTEKSGNWYKTTYNNITGYVSVDWVK